MTTDADHSEYAAAARLHAHLDQHATWVGEVTKRERRYRLAARSAECRHAVQDAEHYAAKADAMTALLAAMGDDQ